MVITALITVMLLVALIVSNIRPALLFVSAVGGLYLCGEVTQATITTNITNSSVLILILLMLSSLVLERTLVLTWLSSKIFHPSYKQTIFRLGVSTAVSSAFLNNTAVVATLMASVQKNQEHPPSKLLMPLSFFAILGGTLTLIGTSTNLLINALLIERGLLELEFFSFLPVGMVLLLCVGGVIAINSKHLVATSEMTNDLGSYFIDAEVLIDSKLIGHSVIKNGLRSLDGLFLAEIVRGNTLISPVSPSTIIECGDKLVFTGDVSQVTQLQNLPGVEIFAASNQLLTSNLSEVIVSPESILIGHTLKNTDFRSRFDAAVVAISRQGQCLSGKLGEQVIRSGDKLVLATGNDFHKRQNLSRNFFFLDGKVLQPLLTIKENILAIGGFITAIVISITTSISLLESITVYLSLMVATHILTGTLIRRRFPFELWLILVCALSIAQAFSQSGLAVWITNELFELLGKQSVYLALIVLFIVTVMLTETITNSAAAAIMLPIAIAFSNTYQVSHMPFIMAVAYGASACFISPFGYQTNLMVMNAGGYKVKDFIKVGWKISVAYSIVALIVIPIFFPF